MLQISEDYPIKSNKPEEFDYSVLDLDTTWIALPSRIEIKDEEAQYYFGIISTISATESIFTTKSGHYCVLTTNKGSKNYKVSDPQGKCPDWTKFKLEDHIMTNGPDGFVWKLYSAREFSFFLDY